MEISSFQLASIRQIFCTIRGFSFFISFLFSSLLAPHPRLWVPLSCASQSDNWISQGTSYWEVEFVLFGGTTLVADLVGISVSGHPLPLPGWVTAKGVTSKSERMRLQRWFTNQRFRIKIHTTYRPPALSTPEVLGEVSMLAHTLLILTDWRERCRNIFSVCLCFR